MSKEQKTQFKELFGSAGIKPLAPGREVDMLSKTTKVSPHKLPFKHPDILYLFKVKNPKEGEAGVTDSNPLGYVDTKRELLNIQGSEYSYSSAELPEEPDLDLVQKALFINGISINREDLTDMIRMLETLKENPNIPLVDIIALKRKTTD